MSRGIYIRDRLPHLKFLRFMVYGRMQRWLLNWELSYLNNNFYPSQRQNISQTKCNAGTQTLARKLVEYKECIDALPHVFYGKNSNSSG